MTYPEWFDEIVRCPETGSALKRVSDGYLRADGRKYPVKDEIAQMVDPSSLTGLDASYNRFYNAFAPFYDFSERFFGKLLTGLDMVEGRMDIVSRIGISAGQRLLEVSPGPGVFQKSLRAKLCDTGEFVSLDLSFNMLRQCRLRNPGQNVWLIQGDGQSLPFADNSFDTLFHFGGVNLFNDANKAIREFIRVVKRNGIVSWGDEGFSKDYKSKTRRKILATINPGFLKPMPKIPDSLRDVKLHEVYGGLGYLVVARKN